MKQYLSLVFCILFANFSKAQKPFIFADIQEIQSLLLKEKRILNIYLPEGYSPDSSKTYPVIYLLDGSANEDFIHIVGAVQFLSMIDKMPKAIVVGIGNIDRKRDFTFPTTVKEDLKDFPTTGKSGKFITFIEQELQPFIEQKYKTNSSKTIIGQSLGGLLATEILFKHPQLFSNYIIVSPSLWWDNESIFTGSENLLAKIKNIKIYLSVGSEGKTIEGDTQKLYSHLRENIHISTFFNPLPKENHLTILHNSVYQGLENIFKKTGN